jgi:hypothetical protein
MLLHRRVIMQPWWQGAPAHRVAPQRLPRCLAGLDQGVDMAQWRVPCLTAAAETMGLA